ncbi:hypothetical protein FHG87_019468 [Trinorchestia longiramus]|nr:hypothetical protein FHG87_019468 [Trinorchestia longiramus]
MTRLELRYEWKFSIDRPDNKTAEVNTAMRLGPVTTGSTTLTNERSRSGSRTQPTAQYKEAVWRYIWVAMRNFLLELIHRLPANPTIYLPANYRSLSSNFRWQSGFQPNGS